jgi:hypothetical protein
MRIRTIIMAGIVAAVVIVGYNAYIATQEVGQTVIASPSERQAHKMAVAKNQVSEQLDRTNSSQGQAISELKQLQPPPQRNQAPTAVSNDTPASTDNVPSNQTPAAAGPVTGQEPGAAAGSPAGSEVSGSEAGPEGTPVLPEAPPKAVTAPERLDAFLDTNMPVAHDEWRTAQARHLDHLMENWKGYYEQANEDYELLEERYRTINEISRQYFRLSRGVANEMTDPNLRSWAYEEITQVEDQYWQWHQQIAPNMHRARQIKSLMDNVDRAMTIARGNARLDEYIQRQTIEVPPSLLILEKRIGEFLEQIDAPEPTPEEQPSEAPERPGESGPEAEL